ncbi:MAG: formylglycine-generating enzyme family protein [Planctomycetes bacterium]|nr:formylglycine-generating enzyme family protein [Planctomycetota bacterium]
MTKIIGIAMIVFVGAWWVLGAASPSPQPATQSSLQPAKELSLDLGNKVSMKLVLILAGKFMMGSPEDEKGRNKNEGPQREVTISKPFYMGIYEVTQEQYEQVMGKNPSDFKGRPANPVECVSWNNAVEFCRNSARNFRKRRVRP